jgi:hypothetical protein
MSVLQPLHLYHVSSCELTLDSILNKFINETDLTDRHGYELWCCFINDLDDCNFDPNTSIGYPIIKATYFYVRNFVSSLGIGLYFSIHAALIHAIYDIENFSFTKYATFIQSEESRDLWRTRKVLLQRNGEEYTGIEATDAIINDTLVPDLETTFFHLLSLLNAELSLLFETTAAAQEQHQVHIFI